VYIVSMLSKIRYAVQPFPVGPKKTSLAFIIPAKVTQECKINPSTIFAVKLDKKRKTLTLQMIDDHNPSEKMIPVGDSLGTTNQHVSEDTDRRL
jgi:hypothetical protein